MPNNEEEGEAENTSGSRLLPKAVRVPHTRVRLGKSKNVIYSTYQHVLELYGPQMPVLVAESLHHTPSAKFTASAYLNPENAWAWYVCGRKLLVWHIPSYTNSLLPVMAKEMLLPSSDLAHHANLVYVFSVDKQVAPSCIAVSPEGVIRYWEVIGHHSSWVDVNANLGGEEVCGVYYIPPLGCLAVTTSGTMVIITPTVVRGTPTVSTRLVSEMQGWFGNIGRRVSSIIFGGANQPQALEPKTVKVVTFTRVTGYWSIYMLSGLTLNSWAIEIEGTECNHIYEYDLEPVIRKAFPEPISEVPDCEVQITDVKKSDTGTIIALVVSSKPRCYMIVELNGDDLEPPDTATRMCILSKNNASVLEGPDGNIVQLQFLLLPSTALVYNNMLIFAVPLSGGEETDGEPLDVPGGAILGGLRHKTTPVIFCPIYGFVSITPVDTSAIDVLNTSIVYERVTPRSIVEREPSTSTTNDSVTQLKVAFVHYIRKNMKLCLQVLKSEFPIEENAKTVDSLFAKTLVKVSLDIINDLSPKDHRWGPVKEGPKLSGTFSLQLDIQLAEKRRAHNVFLNFVREISSSINLGIVSRQGVPVRTIHILYEHNEKIVACIVVRRLLKRFPKLVNRGITQTANRMNFVPSQAITRSDFFFRYVSIIDEFMKCIMRRCIKLSYRNSGSIKFAKLLYATNEVVILIFENVLRSTSRKGYYIDQKYAPWLSSDEKNSVFDYLNNLATVNYDVLWRFGRGGTSRSKKLIKQFFFLANAVLFVRMPYAKPDDFNKLSSNFIEFFITFKEPIRALQLAYKYKNFEYLVKLSFAMKQESQIRNFIDAFGDEGFCLYLFKYLFNENKYCELLQLELPEKYNTQLESFLKEIPTLYWLFKLKQENYNQANSILMNIGTKQCANLRHQTVIFSLAKLTALAEGNKDLSKINRNLDIIKSQKKISPTLYTRKGYDIDALSMLPPSELIELYTSEENFEGDEHDFKKAIDVLKYVEDPSEREVLRKKIFTRALERNNWEDSKSDFSPDVVESFTFFKLLNLLKCSGETYKSFIPSVEEFIDDSDLKMFSKNSIGCYLLEYGYEMVMGVDGTPFSHEEASTDCT